MTKEEKHKIYTVALQLIEDELYSYCCLAINDAMFRINNNHIKLSRRLMIELFPELYNQKTTHDEYIWFWDRAERIKALKKCIELTK